MSMQAEDPNNKGKGKINNNVSLVKRQDQNGKRKGTQDGKYCCLRANGLPIFLFMYYLRS